jgi:hypothetical protein
MAVGLRIAGSTEFTFRTDTESEVRTALSTGEMRNQANKEAV